MSARHSSPAHEERCSSTLHSLSSIHFASAIVTAAILATLAFAACAPDQPTDPLSIERAAIDRLNEGDVDGYIELVADNAVMLGSYGEMLAGSQAIREALEPLFSSGVRRIELSDVKVDGDTVTLTQTHYLNNQLEFTDYDYLIIVRDGKIVFEGPEMFRRSYCSRDPSQTFCPAE